MLSKVQLIASRGRDKSQDARRDLVEAESEDALLEENDWCAANLPKP